MKITFEKGEKFNQIKFYVSIKVLIEVIDKKMNKVIVKYWLGLSYKAVLNNGLKDLELLRCEEYSKNNIKKKKFVKKFDSLFFCFFS